jgi:hypothetical protein
MGWRPQSETLLWSEAEEEIIFEPVSKVVSAMCSRKWKRSLKMRWEERLEEIAEKSHLMAVFEST